jgi:hypothetical protein
MYLVLPDKSPATGRESSVRTASRSFSVFFNSD